MSTLLAGAILLGAFVRHAVRRGSAALIDLQLFENRNFSTATTTQFLSNAVLYARQLLVPLYLITGCALSPSQAGWMMATFGLGMLCAFPLMRLLTERYGCRAVSAGGALLGLLAVAPFLWMIQYQFSLALTVISLFVAGAGQGTISIPSVSAAYASVSKAKLADATTALNIVQRLGGPLATTVIAVVISLSAPYFPASGPRPFLIAFVLLVGLHVLVLGSASRLPVLMPHNRKLATVDAARTR